MEISSPVAEFWERFRSASASADLARFYEAFYFGDSEELANSLADLVLQGTGASRTTSRLTGLPMHELAFQAAP